MKLLKYITVLFPLMIISCGRNDGGTNNSDNNQPPYFKTQGEAVLKGKNDLLSILRSSAFQFTIDPQLLERSQPGITVKHQDIDFDRLLKEENPVPLDQLVKDSKSNINTLMVENNVVTVVKTAKSDKGWTVTGLADAMLANELDEVLNAQPRERIQEVTLYEIDNLQAFVYQVKTLDGSAYFSSYNGFTLKQGASIEELFPVLHEDAQVFERKYGSEIKRKKLVK
jgi:hypothetical protein